MLSFDLCNRQRYKYRVLQTIQMKLIFPCVWAEQAILGSAKTALKFKYELQMYMEEYKVENQRNYPWFKPWFKILLPTKSIVYAKV